MPKWTTEQEQAFTLDNCNIIVSAGAGSGKTAVLTERVLQKVKKNISVSNLLILTFTKAAAEEMKERIRKALSKHEEYQDEVERLDSAYITTFDSFALSLVKKYHYVLNIPKNISITPESIIYIHTKQTLEAIFNEKYSENDPIFNKMINDFCVRDDKDIINQILNINNKLNQKLDKEEYLNDLIINPFTNKKIDYLIQEYQETILNKTKNIILMIDNLINGCVIKDTKTYDLLIEINTKLIRAKTSQELLEALNISFPRKNKDCTDDFSKVKEGISKEIEETCNLLKYQTREDYINDLNQITPYIKLIAQILNTLERRVKDYKKQYSLYTFTDIAFLAIKLVKDNENIKEEIRNTFKEIMIDEYQDTSDIQEALISLISNDNLYMVGDVKQSIYRFRNANLNLFKSKYDSFISSKDKTYDKKGIKIDLLNNFRSRKEVIKGINQIFKVIMNDDIGGADYQKSHMMISSNPCYSDNHESDYEVEVLNYKNVDDTFLVSERECFSVCHDILQKIDNKYIVYDKEKNLFRPCTYKDFCILCDKAKDFDTYRKIFEYMQIPICINKDESLLSSYVLKLIRNIMRFIMKIQYKEYDKEFEYLYYSIARSYLFSMSDEEIIRDIKGKSIIHSLIYEIAINITNKESTLSNASLLEKVFDDFGFLDKAPLIGDVEKTIAEIKYLIELGKEINKQEMHINEYIDLLDCLIEENLKLDYSVFTPDSDSVKLMTIHKSKGLEFPICYFVGLKNKFNEGDIKALFLYTDSLLITPYFDYGIKETFLKRIIEYNYRKEDISEHIRLFYVALTRAREKIILVDDIDEEVSTSSTVNIFKCLSFSKLLMSVYNQIDYKEEIVKNIIINKDYNNPLKYSPLQKGSLITTIKHKLETKESNKQRRYSKTIHSLITSEEKEKMELGTRIHYLLETIDFNLLSATYIANETSFSEIEKKVLNNLLLSPFLKNIKEKKVYKEYQFFNSNTNNIGIIDLMIEDDDEITIVDYKLSNINDLAYVKQVSGYIEYIKGITTKHVYGYIYSLLTNEIKKIS